MGGTEFPSHDPRFGRSIVPLAARSAQQRSDLPLDRAEARAMIRDRVPALPGVYGYLDDRCRLLYVGKSKSLRHRLTSYQAANPPDPKMTRIVKNARSVMWESCSHELLALVREQELITRWQPSMNRMGQPLRRQPVFIKVDLGIAPGISVGRHATLDTHLCFGPIAGTKEVNQAVISIAYAFGLRDCPSKVPMHFRDQLELFPQLRAAQCLRFELNTCPGPCAAGCSKQEYASRVAETIRFLRGDDRAVLGRLQAEMFAAAERKAFERATIHRNQFEELSWLDRRLETLRRARHDLHGLLPIKGFRGRTVWLVLQYGQLVEIIASSGKREDADVQRHVASRAASASPDQIPVTMHQVYVQMILHSWFRKHPQDLDQLVSFESCGVEVPASPLDANDYQRLELEAKHEPAPASQASAELAESTSETSEADSIDIGLGTDAVDREKQKAKPKRRRKSVRVDAAHQTAALPGFETAGFDTAEDANQDRETQAARKRKTAAQ